jgi:hypothetical protein
MQHLSSEFIVVTIVPCCGVNAPLTRLTAKDAVGMESSRARLATRIFLVFVTICSVGMLILTVFGSMWCAQVLTSVQFQFDRCQGCTQLSCDLISVQNRTCVIADSEHKWTVCLVDTPCSSQSAPCFVNGASTDCPTLTCDLTALLAFTSICAVFAALFAGIAAFVYIRHLPCRSCCRSNIRPSLSELSDSQLVAPIQAQTHLRYCIRDGSASGN